MMGEVIRVSGRSTDAAELLREAMLSQRFADVTLCCPGGQRFLAHRLVLSAASPYLQEVLLAHSKSAVCEPTTMILAEVEAPELAAILAFVYTGSATIPRGRIDGFLRAAEALRIRLPPIPPIVLDALKSEEDVKPATDYHECSQFPACAECCRPHVDKSSAVYPPLYARETNYEYWGRPEGTYPLEFSPGEAADEEEYVDVTGFEQDYENLSTKGSNVGDFPGIARPGQEVACVEGCCDWRRARRRVANRVTASPWRQIVRVHHSPRIQQRSHADDKIDRRDEPLRVSVIERTGEDFRPSRIIEESPGQIRPPSPPDSSLLGPQLPPVTSNFPVESARDQQSNATARTATKLEISHPVSRLCDTLESKARKETAREQRSRDEVITAEKPDATIVLSSDDNNNNNNSNATTNIGLSQRGKTAAEEHKCEECGKTFVTRASLKVHSRTHTGEKPFRCADCGKEFSQLRNYKYHRSVHEGTREFAATCPECGKYFNDRGYLSSHMKIHRNRKEYGCAECGKSFNQRVAYNMHVRIHTGVKPHQCEQCGKAFSRKMLLKQHLRTHSGERPYQCQVCHKAFADRSNMTLHTRLHSGLKPYQCTLCSKAFTKKHHLKTHLNYHTGIKPYSCANCGLRFSQSSNMRTHFKKCTLNNPVGLKVERKEGKEVALTPPNSDQESGLLTAMPS